MSQFRVNVDQNDSGGRRQSRQRGARIHRDRFDDPLSCDVCDELRLRNNVCTQRVWSASCLFGAGLRIERGIFSESFCNEVHERTRSPRQHPICGVHKVNGYGWSVVFNEQ